jgi:serine/threonine protein kinase
MSKLSFSAHREFTVRGHVGCVLAEPQTKKSWEFTEGEAIVPGRHAVELLGGGRRYEAYLAWDDRMHALVTVKVLRPHLVSDPGARDAIAREEEALRALHHPALVRCFDADIDGERPHLVLEFLDGPRLSTLIRRHEIIVEQLLPLALELCAALHFIAARGFVHLDVKPKNVIMSAPPRLIDLSVATRLEQVADLASPTGTDAYMAPEQCEPARFGEIGPASDIWGLGVTLYEAISRSLPFPADDMTAEAAGARYPQLELEPRPLGRHVPAQLAELVHACLAKEPGQRPSALEIADTVEPWAARLPQARLGLFRPGGRLRRSVFDGQ